MSGGDVSGAFDAGQVPVGVVWCQVLYAEKSDGWVTMDLVTLEQCSTPLGKIASGAPFTIRSSLELAATTRYDAIVSKWARDGELVVVAFGVTDSCRWICLRSLSEQLSLEVA